MNGPTAVRERTVQLALLARAVLGCPDVLRLYAGPTGRIISATVTGRVVGLLFQGGVLTVGVITRPGAKTDEVIADVRAAVRPMVPGPTPIAVVVSSPRLRTAAF